MAAFNLPAIYQEPRAWYQGGALADLSPLPAISILLRPHGKGVSSFKASDSDIPGTY